MHHIDSMIISRNFWVVQAFALLHAAVAFGCRMAGLTDDIMLTLMSMIMVLIVCLNRKADMRVMAIWVVLANILGYGLGMATGRLLEFVFHSPLVIYPLSTFISTEILGVCADLSCLPLMRLMGREKSSDPENIRWILFAFVGVIVIRLLLLFIPDGSLNGSSQISIFVDYIFSCIALVVVSEYAVRYGRRAEVEAEKANLAQYRYLMLKQQVNPHFLFNSLNILDYMVLEQKTEQASDYIHKLADIYRYMLHNTDMNLVNLSEEICFVNQYIELLKVRFGDALEVATDVSVQAMSRQVVPCSLQVLVENAIKHNALSEAAPLSIRIHAEADTLTVVNPLQPKLGDSTPSTHLGLKYIHRQYSDIAGKNVQVVKTNTEFRVTIPLL